MEGITAKQRNQDLMIWEILSLSRLQKMIKLGEINKIENFLKTEKINKTNTIIPQ